MTALNLEPFIGASAKAIGSQLITPSVYEDVLKNRCILSKDRITQMDYWVSYIAYFYDINFRESLDIIEEQDWLSRIIRRIPYTNPQTARQMEEIENHMKEFIHNQYQ
ncbi:hypothetical protein [Faecalicatena sp.]|uniref:hypothetical protein n=1 Tax=Faecalicatena sp. TaxID=2005360 RepID=UPI002A9DBF2B|nr:hypothetical protein [Lachnospiraceae bacterium]